ncbi:MAG: universal stress protein [Deltaproteobacteria bacterium]|nr:universal stress protein [Deltaproteobacteria bacterium]
MPSRALKKPLTKPARSNCRGSFQKKIAYGDPTQEILKAIDSEGIDMVVMGTHGRKGLDNVLFGSVARNVVRRSPVPVLTVNPYKVK